ncbi:MAG: PTS system mannose/fructose/sorbose family transporter subunit IID [Desulfovibrionaceae bacterium]|nr:PTS system mannose/fructose/sorbose family transporter subunit IID [Desulfovibrionaceae bacterium]MBF0514400.1 PTS system mannose/fructose/sorbose family transporter subunit IID [Desulfovibrionaceae bacterium]
MDVNAERISLPVGQPSVRTLLRCLARCYVAGGAFNTRGLQNIGLAYVMEPGLSAIYRDPAELKSAWQRYLKVYNTHPFWTPLLAGIFLSLETKISRGLVPADMLEKVKGTTAFTLSALGDSFFGGSLSVAWALVTCCLVALGAPFAAFWLGAACFAALQAFRAATLVQGYRQGFLVLQAVKRWDLINWGRRLKVVNALLLLALWRIVWPAPASPLHSGLLASGLCVSVLAVSRAGWTREVVLALALLAIPFFSWLGLW